MSNGAVFMVPPYIMLTDFAGVPVSFEYQYASKFALDHR